MINELLFFVQCIIIAFGVLFFRRIGFYAQMGYITVLALLANLFCLKAITLFGLTASSADVFTIGSYVSFALFKKERESISTIRVTLILFCLLFFYTLITQINLLYIPAHGDLFAGHCQALFSPMPRLMIASSIAYAVSFFVTGFLIDLSRSFMLFIPDLLIMVAVLLTVQLLDTLIFSFLGLSGLVPNLWQIIVMSFAIKALGVIIMTVGTSFWSEYA